jgi:hypothetical protein
MASLITLLLVVEGWLDQLERVGFWRAFPIILPKDNMLIAECRQSLALIEMPAGKLRRLPESWENIETFKPIVVKKAVSQPRGKILTGAQRWAEQLPRSRCRYQNDLAHV